MDPVSIWLAAAVLAAYTRLLRELVYMAPIAVFAPTATGK
jgi:hypothetical protein